MTIRERLGGFDGVRVAWIGDGNNVCASFLHVAGQLGFKLRIASPKAYSPDLVDLARAKDLGAVVELTDDPLEAVRGADAVIADTFVSMGDTDYDDRIQALMPYQVDEVLMAKADPEAVFLHCLPAHRGEEVTEGVIDGPQSVVFDEAENRLHVQKALLVSLLA